MATYFINAGSASPRAAAPLSSRIQELNKKYILGQPGSDLTPEDLLAGK